MAPTPTTSGTRHSSSTLNTEQRNDMKARRKRLRAKQTGNDKKFLSVDTETILKRYSDAETDSVATNIFLPEQDSPSFFLC